MPELPEVETTRRGIEPWVVGNTLTDWQIRQPQLRWPVQIPDQLRDQIVHSVARRGKYLLFRTNPGYLIIHLGMSGSLRVIEDQAKPRTHDHVDLIFADGQILRFNDPRRFGCILFQTGDDAQVHRLLEHLGPEPLGNEFSGEYLFRTSRGRKGAVKNFVMDSKVVVGVGNIYAAEALFLAGIRPATAAGRIPQRAYDKLARAIQQVLARSIREGGTTLRDFVGSDGNPGYFKQRLQVYGREGQACRQCGSTLKRQLIGQRSSVYCPACQSSSRFN